ASIMNKEFDLFINLAEELARAFVREQIEYVVGDAPEGYNPAHDVCRLLINAAVEIAAGDGHQSISNFDISLTSRLGHFSQAPSEGAIWLHLDETTLGQKLKAVQGYTELTSEVERILAQVGVDGLRTECLRLVARSNSITEETPYYELYGEKQVAAGYYQRVLRYREHVLPLAEALQQHVERTNERTASTDY